MMILSYLKKTALVTFAVCSVAFASQASAAISLTTSSTNYVGLINDGIPPSLSNEVTYINTLIARPLGSGPTTVGTEDYTRSSNLCDGAACPSALLAGATRNDGSDNTWTLDGTISYILGKYDASQAGSYVWYVLGMSGDFELPTNLGTCGSTGCGLSHTSLFYSTKRPPQEIPEPVSLALLGLGLIGLGLTRRRK